MPIWCNSAVAGEKNYRMSRNFLNGAEGDRINAILVAAGYNMRKLIAAFLYALIKRDSFLQNKLFKIRRCLPEPYFYPRRLINA